MFVVDSCSLCQDTWPMDFWNSLADSHLRSTRITDMCYTSSICMDVENANSDPHGGMASASTHWAISSTRESLMFLICSLDILGVMLCEPLAFFLFLSFGSKHLSSCSRWDMMALKHRLLVFSSLCSLREAPFSLFQTQRRTPQTLQLDSWTLGSRQAVQQLTLGTSTTVGLDTVDSTVGFLLQKIVPVKDSLTCRIFNK